MNRKALALALVFVAASGFSLAHTDVIKGTGLPMQFELYGVKINSGSSLRRPWVIINDESLSASITRYNKGLNPNYDRDDRRWIYKADYTVEIREPITAIEIKIIPFNIWGEPDTVLVATEIKDFDIGKYPMKSEWRAYDNDVIEHYASIIYISALKLANGKVIRADPESIVDEARLFSSEFEESDLQPDED